MTRQHLIGELTLVVNNSSNSRDSSRAEAMRDALESGFDILEGRVMEFINEVQARLV